jgi:lipopolysaccharide/colanic/teichoic acid biosynthesis glycosyltransferase
LPEYLPYYTEEEKHRHDVRPGLTGLAQVNGRNAIDWDTKLTFDVEYVSDINFIEDVKIIYLTVYKVLKHDDILVGKEFKAGKFIDQRKERQKNFINT